MSGIPANINGNTLGFGLRYTDSGMAIVVKSTTFGMLDETEELPLDHAREILQGWRQQLKAFKER